MHTLLFLDPAHFHAALTLRRPHRAVDREVHVYAPPGTELDAFLALVESFNSREVEPTDWRIVIHSGASTDDSLDALIAEARGDIVVLAGRNDTKLAHIDRLTDAGFNVLADKPWVTRAEHRAVLDRVVEREALALDIMTERFAVVSGLVQAIATTPALFGAPREATDEPAIEISSVHHLVKQVNGATLRRPPWFYDVSVQGDGLSDIQSHMTDQVVWLLGDPEPLDFERDYRLERAERWATTVALELFRESTGETSFPANLPVIEGERLELACNGRLEYRLRGVSVRQNAEWGLREAPGGGDLHARTVRGSACDLLVRQGRETGYVAEVHACAPGEPGHAPSDRDLWADAIAELQGRFPGLSAVPSSVGLELQVPAALRTSHESHFPQVLAGFIERLAAPEATGMTRAALRARYSLLAEAQRLARG